MANFEFELQHKLELLNLNQWVSFAGGCSIVLANSLWVFQMLYYKYINPQPGP
jgi:hypothetical protein